MLERRLAKLYLLFHLRTLDDVGVVASEESDVLEHDRDLVHGGVLGDHHEVFLRLNNRRRHRLLQLILTFLHILLLKNILKVDILLKLPVVLV